LTITDIDEIEKNINLLRTNDYIINDYRAETLLRYEGIGNDKVDGNSYKGTYSLDIQASDQIYSTIRTYYGGVPDDYKPETSGYDPNDDIVTDRPKTATDTTIDTFDAPVIRVTTEDEIDDIPVIRLQN
jgi:hypothetical protein